jgi:multimeric flavodoxin WrbA
MKKAIVIFGSSRPNGNTMQAVKAVLGGNRIEVVDVARREISAYDYAHRNANDEFLDVAQRMVKSDAIIFATPVYWYAMSAQLKTFVDRLTDVLQLRKDVGRALAGKDGYLVASGSDPALPRGFEQPFALTCKYFGMRYGGSFYHHVRKPLFMSQRVQKAGRTFGREILGR